MLLMCSDPSIDSISFLHRLNPIPVVVVPGCCWSKSKQWNIDNDVQLLLSQSLITPGSAAWTVCLTWNQTHANLQTCQSDSWLRQFRWIPTPQTGLCLRSIKQNMFQLQCIGHDDQPFLVALIIFATIVGAMRVQVLLLSLLLLFYLRKTSNIASHKWSIAQTGQGTLRARSIGNYGSRFGLIWRWQRTGACGYWECSVAYCSWTAMTNWWFEDPWQRIVICFFWIRITMYNFEMEDRKNK